MNKHRTHQIDDLAQRVFRDALPTSWVPNEQHKDYGKDYLVEIGEDNGDLTGSSFYVQLKGKEQADISADGTAVKFPLETKHAAYYLDKVKDLPVFLVVVDVNLKKGWWVFLQPVLDADQSWREQDSVTVSVPSSNDLADTARLRTAVEEAKRWMRVAHPESITDAVVGHKERIAKLDPRFDVGVTLVANSPQFTLMAKEPVPIQLTFRTEDEEQREKVRELIDKGTTVVFQPGEVTVTGSKLFESFEKTGGAMQMRVELPATVTLVVEDASGSETGRLSDVPGHLVGGLNELRFDGGFARSPLRVGLGPIARDTDGAVRLGFAVTEWDGQRLAHLAHFDRIHSFFQAHAAATRLRIRCEHDGNEAFSAIVPLSGTPSTKPLAGYLELLRKARRVVQKFNVNPVWGYKTFNKEEQEAAQQLHGIFFEDGWVEPTPDVRLTTQCVKKTFQFDVANKLKGTIPFIRITSDGVYAFLGEKLPTGRLAHNFTEVKISVDKGSKKVKKGRGGRRKVVRKPAKKDMIPLVVKGTEKTVMSVRLVTPEDDKGVGK